ncbi:hypothetical protein [Microbulbifer spongiae]|uniref:Uncharacterized protein n=1 Tax=Microbulbifer spongiae TaxID=2944933 RepID=A0ABY9EE75_9GAMM|nr:hypothetical protein [Microbulbifer sp. MI-G]WKD51328.1 hypothetical protein M8T91_07890 [Microbulbifer sp. MI-G]
MSEWLPVIIIGLVIGLVLGPVMWLKPNRRDRQLADLRSRAARAGITVQIQALPATAGRGTAAVYSHRWQDRKGLRVGWTLQRQRVAHELNFAGRWDWGSGPAAPKSAWHYLHQLLEKVPVNTYAVVATDVGLGIQWEESGGGQTFAQLLSALAEFGPLIEGAIRKPSPVRPVEN